MSSYSDLIKGKGLVLVTGKKGSGKSHFVTKCLLDIRKDYPKHYIYSNIDGLLIDGIEPVPSDWQDCENNSTIVYDEAQILEWADNSSTKINSDERVKNMTLIRKQNKNIVLITQDPSFIHSALRKLVDYHYHISHPFKDGRPKVFYFAGAKSIDERGFYKEQALESFTHKLDKETSSYYNSIEPSAVHDQKKKIPKKIILLVGAVVIGLLIFIPLGVLGAKDIQSFIAHEEDGKKETTSEAIDNISGTIGDNVSNLSAQKIEDTLPSRIQQQGDDKLQKAEEKYLDEYVREVADYDTVRPTAVIKSPNGDCMAWNKYGDKLLLDKEKCNDLLDKPETMPHSRNIAVSSSDYSDNITIDNGSRGDDNINADIAPMNDEIKITSVN